MTTHPDTLPSLPGSDFPDADAWGMDSSLVSIAQSLAASMHEAKPHATSEATLNHQLYGSFFIDKTEVAVPIALIQEVVNYPEKISTVPLAPAELQGVFNLRGTIIPVLNLRRIFRLSACEEPESQKVAILDIQQRKVGVIFDKTSEIMTVDAQLVTRFSKDKAHHLVEGIIQFTSNDRILQILDCEGILDLDYLPRIEANTHNPHSQQYRRRSSDQRRQCISFTVASAVMAFDISVVNEIIHLDEVQQSILSSDICMGMINLRGNVIPVVDFGKFMAMSDGMDPSSVAGKRLVIIRYHDELFALVVDEVHSIITFYGNEVLPITLDFHRHGRVFQGVVCGVEEKEALLIDHAALFAMEALRELYHGHQRLYQSNQESVDTGKTTQGRERKVRITFKLNEHYGLPITAISEIVSYTSELLCPPGLPAIVEGIMNLRNEMIPIVDLRKFYHQPDYHDRHACKVIIVNHAVQKLGLLVDTVDNIVQYYSEDHVKFPTSLLAHYAEQQEARADEIEETVRIENDHGKPCDYIMLNPDALCRRILDFK